jgi:hypothetical protein
VWADAVCINQNDVEEKNNHVRKIYEYADVVSVWFGTTSTLLQNLNLPSAVFKPILRLSLLLIIDLLHLQSPLRFLNSTYMAVYVSWSKN